MTIETAILNDLKNEVDQTLLFFCKTDILIYGRITGNTVNAFNTQGRKFPEVLKQFCETNKN